MKKTLSYVFATGFGAGYFPFASGTAGSLAALPPAFAAAYFFGTWGVAALAALVYIIGTISTREVLKYTAHDPSVVVVDEIAGQTLTVLPIARFLNWGQLWWWLGAFFLFRLFDITKPQPARFFDAKVLNAHGVMLDDVVAGFYGAAALEIIKICF
ncbi:MAG: phosphatidylglycerophosphatase A [Rickettsiales bacterium]|jgi:phosphatidylglycerophosphatase A|nr:phosphatidylglycerophosphatase A [Rickettsiales bacterium]